MAGFKIKFLELGLFEDSDYRKGILDFIANGVVEANFPTATYAEVRRLQLPQGSVDHTLSGWSSILGLLVFNHGPNYVEIKWTDTQSPGVEHLQRIFGFALLNDIDPTQIFFVEDPVAGTSEVTFVYIGTTS